MTFRGKIMNIAFDIDGVLTNIEKYQLEVARAFYKKKYNLDIVNPEGFSVKDKFDVNKYNNTSIQLLESVINNEI